tara:strand:- start:152 stop:2002 length:1851 start_codon:yes stop_codon:yes gene_type:complete
MINGDKEVKVGKGVEPILVTELISELYKKGSLARSQYLVKADRNERYVNGQQYQDINRLTGVLQDVPWQDYVPKITVNLLRNLVLTWTSRLLRNRPSVSAYPNNAEIADVQSSQAAEKMIEFFEYEMDIDETMFDIVSRACAHGVGGVKIVYDPDTDNVDWGPVTIFDFVLDPQEKSEDSRWVIFERFIEVYEANMLLSEAGIQEKAVTQQYYIGSNPDREGVKVRELWYRPDPRIPEGIYALEVSGHITEAEKYPYVFKRLEDPQKDLDVSFLPLAMFVVDPLRGTCWGDTWMNDAVPIQRQLNEVESTLTKLRRDTAGAKLIAPGNVAKALDTGNQILKVDDPQQAQMIRYMEPPRINNLLFTDRDQMSKRLYDLAGLNELMVGAEAAKSGQSAKTIAYLSELDSMKQAGTARSIERFLLESWRKTLILVRNYYTEPRMLSIVGEDNVLAQTSFIGSDIDGVGLRLEPREGKARYTAQKEQDVIEHSQMGLRDSSEARQMVETGTLSGTEDQRQNMAMSQLVSTILQGADAYVDESVDPLFAIDYLKQAIEIQISTGGKESLIMILGEILQVYEQFQAQQQQQQMQMEAQQQQQQQQGPPMMPQGGPPQNEGQF